MENDWELESGLADNFISPILDFKFGYREAYSAAAQHDVALAILTLENPDPEKPPLEEVYTMGGGWKVIQGGEAVEHERGRTRFTETSKYGQFIKQIVEVLGIDMRGRGSPREAKVWRDLPYVFRWMRIKDDPESIKPGRLFPTEIVEAGQAGPTSEAEAKLAELAKQYDDKAEFQKEALKLSEVRDSNKLTSMVLGDFWEKHRS
jgi:hypothetical protein